MNEDQYFVPETFQMSEADRVDLRLHISRKVHFENATGTHTDGFCKPCADDYFAIQKAVHEFFSDRTTPCTVVDRETQLLCTKKGVHVTHEAGKEGRKVSWGGGPE